MQKLGLIPAARHGRRHSGKVRQAGVTLLELMTVVVVVGVLAVIALPSYRQYSIRAQRTDAKNALLRLATNQERYYLQNHRYGANADLAALGFNTAFSEKRAYAITITAADTTAFTATATVVAGGDFDQTSDPDCASFSINSAGVKGASAPPGGVASRCW